MNSNKPKLMICEAMLSVGCTSECICYLSQKPHEYSALCEHTCNCANHGKPVRCIEYQDNMVLKGKAVEKREG